MSRQPKYVDLSEREARLHDARQCGKENLVVPSLDADVGGGRNMVK
jgi:hypothetical protein